MNKNNRLLRIGIAALLALMMAGAASSMLTAALGLPANWISAWLPALAASALSGLAAWSGVGAIIAASLTAVLGGGLVAAHASSLDALRQWFASLSNSELVVEAAALSEAGNLLCVLTAVLLGMVFFVLLSRRGGIAFALLIYFALLIGCYAANEELSFGYAVPGLIAALSAFAFSGQTARDADAWHVLIPACLAVAVALVLVPGEKLTWEPLERAAQSIRAAFEDYFRFTEERIPFTISTEGYNHAAEVNGSVVAQLGGPATPDPSPVMRVTTDADVLLRGTIRRTYTGAAWRDDDPKARYLYYDFTRRSIREDVFGMSGNEPFAPVSVDVEIMDRGASSLFVPGRLNEFNMDLDTAVYYNSIGEMFLSRQVQPGDRYALTGWQPADRAALREAVIAAGRRNDPDYDVMLATCSQLPSGIEEGVYALTVELTRNGQNAYDKATAIENWLKNNCVYTLEPEYPDSNRDFVSQFVMDGRRGYCSYFASAMTVMCRIAGLPARYVEGYSVRAGENVIVTGENAHAWTEVYFSGIGWVAFDPSNGGSNGDDGLSNDGIDDGDAADDVSEDPGSGDPEQTPEPSPTPTLPPNPESPEDNPFDPPEPTPTPTPDSEDWSGLANNSTVPPEGATPPPDALTPPEEPHRNWTWLWILLAILLIALLAALAAMWTRRRLVASDPIALSCAAQTAQQASMILYRAILTLLAQTGQAPLNGETPGAFARRIRRQQGNDSFVAFADAVARLAYAREDAGRETVDLGRAAYAEFLKSLKRSEKLRFMLVRVFKGLGEFESIP